MLENKATCIMFIGQNSRLLSRSCTMMFFSAMSNCMDTRIIVLMVDFNNEDSH